MTRGAFRVGLGYDVHRLEPGRACVLGGVRLDHPAGPAGHSDGDAVLHALCDAVLGGAGLDDLGTLYQDGDARWKDADSSLLLRECVARARDAGWRVESADVVVIADAPRIGPARAQIRATLATLLELGVEAVNVKGKSTEGLGALAGGAGVAVHAVCLLVRA